MRIVFCGTPAFAVPTLKAILADPEHTVVAVITQPDRPSGRGQEISFSAVKQAALDAGIAVRQPEKIRAPEAKELLQTFEPECFVIIAYGQIIPAGLLPISKCGWINLHGSLLPKYRGAAPINWAIANGELKTGLTTMRIDAGMDTGEMLLQEEVDIDPHETSAGAGDAHVGNRRGADAGDAARAGQRAGHCEEAKRCAGDVCAAAEKRGWTNRLDAAGAGHLQPHAGVHSVAGGVYNVSGKDVPDLGRAGAQGAGSGGAGHDFGEDGEVRVACGDATVLRVLTVKQEGRSEMTAQEFANGARLADKERFGHS